MDFKRQYIVDENDHRIAVQLDIKTFEMIEETLENFALFSKMKEVDDDAELELDAARLAYTEMTKA